MDIEGGPQVFRAHSRAFYMPSWSPFTPRAFPRGLAWLCLFPEDKIQWIPLFLIHGNPSACDHILEVTARELSILCKGFNREVDISINDVGMSFVHEAAHHIEHIIDMLGCPGFHIGIKHSQRVHILIE